MEVGDKVKFIGKVDGDSCPGYTCDKHLVSYGSTYMKKNEGVIKGKFNDGTYYIEYLDRDNKKVCLGFTIDKFEIISSPNSVNSNYKIY